MRILAVVLYVGFIFALSSWRDPPSIPKLSSLDKAVHLVEYGILGLLLAWAAMERGWRGWRRLAMVMAIGCGVAVGDELYQRSTPGRSSSARDVLADLAGLGFAGGLVEAQARARSPRAGASRR